MGIHLIHLHILISLSLGQPTRNITYKLYGAFACLYIYLRFKSHHIKLEILQIIVVHTHADIHDADDECCVFKAAIS